MSSFLKARGKRALSQCVAYREMLIKHCEERLALWDQGIENYMKISYHNFASERPNVDIRHGKNLTPDGDYKRKWLRGQSPEGTTVVNLPGWGRPQHFERRTGYRQPEDTTDAAAYLHRKWARRMPQPTPIRTPRFVRNQLPALFASLGYRRGAEIGVRKGRFSARLCQAIPDLELLCIDLWDAYYHFTAESGQSHYEFAKEALAKYNATLIRAKSVDAVRDVPDASLDFVYIDADHRFDYVMEDLIAWGRKVRPGGIISGHDYYRFRNAGVVPAVDVYTHCHYIDEWFITDEKEASFFWVKQKDPQ